MLLLVPVDWVGFLFRYWPSSMREGCATGMHQLKKAGGMDVADEFKEALRQRMGADRFNLWFGHGVGLEVGQETVTITTDSLFSAERLRLRHSADVRAVAQQVCGSQVRVHIVHDDGVAQAEDSSGSVSASVDSASVDAASIDCTSDSSAEPSGERAEMNDATDKGQPTDGAAKHSSGQSASRTSRRGMRSLQVKRFQASATEPVDAEQAEAARRASQRWSMSLNNFIVGPCNELAHTATRMVVEQPGSASPVYFWGPSGTGKSHLMTSIRDLLRRKHRLPRVIQLTAEDFTNDFTTAIRGSGLPAFRRRYRDVDALLVDDVQFFGGNKRATLRELQHTVDALMRTRKQLIFAADRPPMEIEGLPAELAGRLSGGMMCGVSVLDVATRQAVLQQFAAMVGLELPESLLQPLAETASGDGRVLSGLINQVRALEQMRGKLPNWQQVLDSAAGDILRSAAPIIGLSDIQKAVCDTFGLPSGTLQSRGQQRSVSQPRMLAMYLARQHTRAAYSEIGNYFGNRSHSTVIAATKRVQGWLQNAEGQAANASDCRRMRQAAAAIENMLRTG